MGDISKNFNRSEFKCKGKTCGCSFEAVDVALVSILEDVREHFDKPVKINSACRCGVHNRNVGGAKHSFHLYGMAADIAIRGVSTSEIYKYIDETYPDQLGIIQYGTFVHVDVRPFMYRKTN